MNTENKVEERGLSLSDILFIIKRNILFIILITVIFTLAGIFYGLKVKKPTYTATSTAVVVIDMNTNTSQATNFVYASYYTSTFTAFIQSNPVLKRACDMINNEDDDETNDISRGELASYVGVSAQEDSLIITISATVSSDDEADGKKRATTYANTLLKAAIAEANETIPGDKTGEVVYKYKPFAENLILMEEAYEDDVVKSTLTFTIVIICMLLGIALSFGLSLINYLLDDTYTSKELFEKTYGINVLSVVAEIVEYGDGGKK